MAVDVWRYSELLAEQLRLNGMKEEQVQEVVAQVQAHTLVTHEDPVEAFGQPADYALQWAVPNKARWIRRILGAVVGVTGIWALATGLAAGGPWGGDVDIESFTTVLWASWVVSIALVPWTFDVWMARRRARRAEAAGREDWVLRLIAATLIVTAYLVVLWAMPDRGSAGALLTMPKWALVAIGVACLPGLPFIGIGQRRALPKPPGHRSWKTRVRRTFINR